MGFSTRKRLYRHLTWTHEVNPEHEDNEENRELIQNPPPLPEVDLATKRAMLKQGRRKRKKETKIPIKKKFKKSENTNFWMTDYGI
jgi:hypothetical protein